MHAALEAETARFGTYVYVDRQDGALLRLGFGKHVGTPLHEVEPSYLSWALGLDQLPPAAADAMREALEGGSRSGGGGGGGGSGSGTAAAEVAAVVAAAEVEVTAQAKAQADVRAEVEAKAEVGTEVGAGAGARPKKVSETDHLETDAEKLAYRMAQGFFSVVETGTGDAWLQAYHPAVRDAYVVRPGKGGYAYLRNVAGRLQAVGFRPDATGKLWVRPKVVDGVRSAIDLTTLQELPPVPAAAAGTAAPAPPAPRPADQVGDSPVDTKTGLPLDFWD